MHNRIPDYFNQFHCLAGSCPDTCCGQWEIVVDEAAKARYLSVEGELGDKIKNALTVIDGEDCMALEHGHCPLLTEDGLCSIVLEKGEEFLSTTCHTHPRFTEIYGALSETMLSVSCPEAARLLLERTEPVKFIDSYDQTPIDGPSDFPDGLLECLIHSRATAMLLVQDRSRPMADRLALLLNFSHRLQNLMDHGRYDSCVILSGRFRAADYQAQRLIRMKRLRRNGTYTSLRQVLLSMEHLGSQFPALLKDLEWTDLEPFALPLEHLAVYYLFRWWLKASRDDQIYVQGAACAASLLAVASLARQMGSFPEAARLYSKEVEHSEDNMALLRRAMTLPPFQWRYLIRNLEERHAI